MFKIDKRRADPVSSSLPLPCEIWQAIIRNLPKSTVWRLRELNKMLYDLALNELVRYTSILLLGGLETEKTIRLLGLLFEDDAETFDGRPPNLFNDVKSTLQKVCCNLLPRWMAYVVLSYWALATGGTVIINNGWRIARGWITYVICSNYPETRLLDYLWPFLWHHWSIFFSDMPQPSDPFGPSTALFLPHLEELALELRRAPESASMQNDSIERLLGQLIPKFISRHLTLRALTFNVPPSLTPSQSLSLLFHALSSPDLTSLPLLRSFSITNPIVSFGVLDYESTVTSELDSLAGFLHRYVKQLTTIQLDLQVHRNTVFTTTHNPLYYNFSLPSAGTWFSHALYNLPFSCLHSLDLSLMFYDNHPIYTREETVPAFCDFLRPLVERGLRRLKLRDYIFEPEDDFLTLLEAFPFQEREEGLIELDISVRYISPSILNLLAERLPALEILALTFEAWTSKKLNFTSSEADISSSNRPSTPASIPLSDTTEKAVDHSPRTSWPRLRLLRLNCYGPIYPFYSHARSLVAEFPDWVLYQNGDLEPFPGEIWPEKGFCPGFFYGPSAIYGPSAVPGH
ncbi:hypothetical protein NP233_g12608 [Leucocoprinus birnbaumii]|uniref:F-box domain-containing protein n=1 Tax=Leucocoprinus birnbaumii TaxID=56174 RepID=A0AAD5VEE6_9AGAR|nr:hypothetical protein NP233_g12608 [Leucocoprinus birnbaumii]